MPNQNLAVSVSAGAQATWSDPLPVDQGHKVAISVSGTFTATVTLQRRLNGVDWRDVDTWTVAAEETYEVDVGQDLRIGIDTGDFTSGTAVCLLRKPG